MAGIYVVHIKAEYCKGCGYCMELCPKKILERSEEMTAKGFYPPTVSDQGKCTGCMICESICPDFAIYVEEEENDSLRQ